MWLIVSNSEKNVTDLHNSDFLAKTSVFEKHNLNAQEEGQGK